MCIAVPAEVLEIKEGNIGVVDYGDLRQEVRLDLVDVEVGEFVLVHVGFAIQKLSREEALETRKIFAVVYAAMEE
ncbi:MAG TPA: HypC/HybG/HupF family hydrogenase formation chaperone [Methanoculleus sp.]|nr:HypC/HybG/HupF family hydrogenase formation chaperone [Methanoculleus sp.]